MVHRLTFLLLVCFLLPALVLGQVQADDKLTPSERKEIQDVCKRFIEQFMQTRDVRPLAPEFFLKDFAPLINKNEFEWITPKLFVKVNRRREGSPISFVKEFSIYVADHRGV